MYRKEWFIFDGDRPLRAVIRNYSTADYEGLLRIQQESFPHLIRRSCYGAGSRLLARQSILQMERCVWKLRGNWRVR